MHALTALWQERRGNHYSVDSTVLVDGHRMTINSKTQVARIYNGDGSYLLCHDSHCAYCAKTRPEESNDGSAYCVHKQALDKVLGDIYSGGQDELWADWTENQERKRLAQAGVL